MAVETQHSVLNPQSYSRFDRVVIGVMALLIALIGATILLGDRVGVQIAQVAPLGKASSTSPITIRFGEAMDHDSVTERFSTDPPLRGVFSWSGTTMSFRAAEALKPGSAYTVSLKPGAVSDTGRELLSEYRYSFTVQSPRVAYLYPADGVPQNVWMVDPADPENPQQITFSPTGLYDFSVSPDGTKIAFSENNPLYGTNDIKLIDIASGALEQLTNCQQAACTTPSWRPDGRMIAYERIEFDDQFGNSPPRIWLIDLTTTPATTRPLFQEPQILGYDAQWSGDGNRIALVDRGSASILVYDFTTGKIISIESNAGATGALSPDGKTLLYAALVFQEGGGAHNSLRIASLDTGEFATLVDPSEPVNDQRAQWSPDGQYVAIAREDERVVSGTQIVLVDMESNETTLLTDDPRYANLFFWWDATGTELLVQRFPELDENLQPDPSARPEIWTLDVTSGALEKVATNGFLPRWVP
jgi:Tol biopolymer transport system component